MKAKLARRLKIAADPTAARAAYLPSDTRPLSGTPELLTWAAAPRFRWPGRYPTLTEAHAALKCA